MVHLPPPIERFFTAKNARDVAEATSVFSEHAVVHDEGGRYEGPASIEAWIVRTGAEYNDHADVLSVSSAGLVTDVVARVSGSFPGSPVDIHFMFTLSNDQIDRLEIR